MIARSISIERIWKTALVLTVALALLGVASGTGDPASIAFGGVVSVANLHLIRLVVSRLMSPDAAGSLRSAVTIKFLILLAVLAVALNWLPLDPASFLVGTTTLFVAIVLDAIWLGEAVKEPADVSAGGGQPD